MHRTPRRHLDFNLRVRGAGSVIRGVRMGLDASVYRDSREEERIASVRLGNASLIAYLNTAIAERAPEAQVLLAKVLYSASHCGDTITTIEVRDIERELRVVETRCSDDPDIREFVRNFRVVSGVALEHDRPITF
jgi:hypothetical protein